MILKNSFADYRKLRRKLFAATSLLLVSALLMVSTSYAWFVVSTSPELSSVATNIGANGALEIALGKDIGESRVGDSLDKAAVDRANRTWGNLVNLNDEGYGLQEITLRPVFLNSAGGAVNTLHPFVRPVYGADGRVGITYANDVFAGSYNGRNFITSADGYGVRGIGLAQYTAPGLEGTFGPMSQRQEIFYNACASLWGRMSSSFVTLCNESKNVLMTYCLNGTGMAAADFDLADFSENVDAVASAANEDLKMIFTMLAAAETTSPENYFRAMELLSVEYPDYESVVPLIDAAAQVAGASDVGAAIAELRAFQNVAAQLKEVIASDSIDGSDGYSAEEIQQTVGLIFDLEKSSFEETEDEKNYKYYSSVISNLVYSQHAEKRGDSWYRSNNYKGSSVDDLSTLLSYEMKYQDASNREYSANMIRNRFYPIVDSLMLDDLDQAISGLFVGHWDYMDDSQSLAVEAEELESRIESLETAVSEQQEQLTALDAEIEALEQQLETASADEKAALQEELAEKQTAASNIRETVSSWESQILSNKTALQDIKDQINHADWGEQWTYEDSRLGTLQTVMENTIEALRQYTLLSIAYFACDGQVPDDAYHHMLEIADSSDYIHPRKAYETLCDYGVTPPDALTQMVETYEKLEKELLFRGGFHGSGGTIAWILLENELQRLFGTITHEFSFNHSYSYYIIDEDGEKVARSVSSSGSYNPENAASPALVMKDIREKIEACERDFSGLEDSAFDGKHSYSYYHSINYGDITDTETSPWREALDFMSTFYGYVNYSRYRYTTYTLEGRDFYASYYMPYTERFPFDISISVGSEDNFNESGLTVRQTRLQTAQEAIAYYQNQLVTAAVNMDRDMTQLLMQMIAGQSNVSLVTISNYLDGLQQQLDDAEALMYQAALAMAASDYADDSTYNRAFDEYVSRTADDLIRLLTYMNFDQDVLRALTQRMELLEEQEDLLEQSMELLSRYQDPDTGALTAEQISAAAAAQLLDPVLDTSEWILYAYVQEAQNGTEQDPTYVRNVLYTGFGAPSVQISGRQATVQNKQPVTVFGSVYLSLGRSLSGSMLALARSQVESYAPPSGSVDASYISAHETGSDRQSYAIGEGDAMYTLKLQTADESYALSADLWSYTGNTANISANQKLSDLYAYCIDLSVRTNVADSDLMLQTAALHRIYNDKEAITEDAMGAGSYMEFSTQNASYALETAQKYMACLRVAITDTNTGYIYGYAALDMDSAEVNGVKIKAPLRLYDKNTGMMMDGDTEQYLCHLDQNLEKNLTVYVYLDGAKATDAIVSAYGEYSLYGVLNLQFSSSAELIPMEIEGLR